MTYIEFFEKDVLENLCACLAAAPDKVILIGDNGKLLQKHAKRYERLLRAFRREVVEFEAICVNKNSLNSILPVLERIVAQEPECAFGLTGGEDLYLVAMGMIYARHPEKNIQMHRFNIRNNTVFDCDADGRLITGGAVPQLGVEELIYAYGGDVVSDEEYPGGTHLWDWEGGFIDQIAAMWDICRADPQAWNLQTGLLASIESFNKDPAGGLTTTVPTADLEAFLAAQGHTPYINRAILKPLHDAGLLPLFDFNDETVTVTYCDAQVKRCLTKAGQLLELAVCAAAMEATEPDGSRTYHDVLTGVTIDWDGPYDGSAERYDTANEIDVIMTRGLVPVFVSCKNGEVDKSELYKLQTVASRFGGKYAKKVLIATALRPESLSTQYFLQRAEDMDIRVVTDFAARDADGVNKLLRSLWR